MGAERHKQRRPRKNLSCIPCKDRKIKCDRNCRWGDERDDVKPDKGPEPWYEEQKPLKSTVPQPAKHIFLDTLPMLPTILLAELVETDMFRWRKEMQTHLDKLPGWEATLDMVSFYMSNMEPIICCMNSAIFNRQLHDLWVQLTWVYGSAKPKSIAESIAGSLGAAPVPREVQEMLFWTDARNYGLLALLFIIINTVEQVKRSDAAFQQDSLDETTAKPCIYFLQHSNYLEEPTLWTLQTCVLLQHYYFRSSRIALGAAWSATAVHLAKLMGLNRLGSAVKDIMHLQMKQETAEDHMLIGMPWARAFAPGDPPQRELGRKIWSTLVTMDWYKSLHVNFNHMVSDNMNYTDLPLALEDDELERMASMSLETLQNRDRVSPNLYVQHQFRIARVVRDISEISLQRLSQGLSVKLPYEHLLEIDSRLHRILQSLPDVLRFDGVTENTQHIRQIHASHSYLPLQRLFMQASVHSRLLRMHMHFLTDGLEDTQYRYSANTCIASACIVIAVWEELQRAKNPQEILNYMMRWHLMVSALALFYVLEFLAKHPECDGMSEEIRTPKLRHAFIIVTAFLEKLKPFMPFDKYGIQANPIDGLSRYSDHLRAQDQNTKGLRMESGIPAVPMAQRAGLAELEPPAWVESSWTLDDAALLSAIQQWLLGEEGGAGVPGWSTMPLHNTTM
ncbi:hypothetical protein MVES_003360 [Malassezia vespertilionis]|uniref:Xylanolytic transcriptional activator regulatory domain-containing protein n=1 Tax=Malassezia vespertilionis TaxID=2020962 RepID=A0A2N1J7N8_9BASI|nr:hypothetical protein MVES_003360 [Malassezia vespertilionis]